jgi:hypothetical protein
MNAPFRVRAPHSPPVARPSSLEIFVTRCEARAAQWAAGEISLHDAVDNCQQAAEAYGLVIELGQDRVQAIMVEIFAPVRDDLQHHDPPIGDEETRADIVSPNSADDKYDGLPSTFAKACRKADEKQSRKPVDPRIERARRLLDDDVSFECAWDEFNAPEAVPTATLDAAEFLIRQKDPARLRAWVKKHTTAERKAILQHLKRPRGKK